MTRSDLNYLLDYNYWARDRMLDAIDQLTPEQFTQQVGGSFKSIRDTAAHMLGAEIVWYMRWVGTPLSALPQADRFADAASLRREWIEHEAKMRAYLAAQTEADVDNITHYKLTTGPSGSATFWQMLQHLVNHGTYHRGQVTTLLRQMGATPPASTDTIGYFRAQSSVRL